jgi:anti-sigma B factor antagonist
MSLTINGNFSETENRWIFQPAGEVDISNAGQLKQQLETAFMQRAADIRLEMSELSYIDSTGLGVMISVYGEMKKTGHRITIVNPKDNVKKLLRITSLYHVLVEE